MMRANFYVKDRNKHKMNEKIVNPNVQFLTISDDEAGQRLDNFLLARLKGVPKSLIYRIVRKGRSSGVIKAEAKPEYKLLSRGCGTNSAGACGRKSTGHRLQ